MLHDLVSLATALGDSALARGDINPGIDERTRGFWESVNYSLSALRGVLVMALSRVSVVIKLRETSLRQGKGEFRQKVLEGSNRWGSQKEQDS